MERIKDAVCLIECVDQEGKPKLTGTGFHYGSGWVMTVGHNFQDDKKKDDKTSHSYLSEGKFRVLFYVGGKEYKFPERKRMAFAHHLNLGEYTDVKNKDIAMVKLGIQYEFGRDEKEYTLWEKEEQQMLQQMYPRNFGLVQADAADPEKNDSVCVVYYGDGVGNKSTLVKETKIKAITKGRDRVPMLHLAKKAGVLPAGTSGCPVMLLEKDGEYHLVGLHFSGDEDDKDGEAEALLWENGIASFIGQGVGIIIEIATYLAYKCQAAKSPDHLKESLMAQAEDAKKNLESSAKKNRLTIYLTDGEIIKGLQ